MKKLLFFITLAILNVPFVFASHQNPDTPMDPAKNYIFRNGNLRFVCEAPCTLPRKERKQAFAHFKNQLKTIEAKFGIPIENELKPIEIYLKEGHPCGAANPQLAEAGGFLHIKEDGRPLVCLQTDWDKVKKGETAFIHELTHIYFKIFRYGNEEDLEEPLVKMIASWVAIPPNVKTHKSPCDYQNLPAQVKKFCDKYHIEYEKIPTLIQRLALRRKTAPVTNAVLIEELNALLRL